MDNYDVIIIGAGVVGAAIARELSRYQLKTVVLEKEEDVCCGTSKANSAIIHAGHDAKSGTLMAKLNIVGNQMMDMLSQELDFTFKRNGSLVVCCEECDKSNLEMLYERGIQNGVKGIRLIGKEELLKMEPNISDQAVAALHLPTGGIVDPFEMTLAFAENAFDNDVSFHFNSEVTSITPCHLGYFISTSKGDYQTKCIVNAAGVYADVIHNMVSNHKINTISRKGEYCLLDKTAGAHVTNTIFALPGKYGKGVLVTPTVHGNLLVGPTAIDVKDKNSINTTSDGINELTRKSSRTVKNIPMRKVITSFAGLRAHDERHEFIIGEVEDAKGFFDCVGIESPGLTSSPAIAVMVADMIKEKLNAKAKPFFMHKRKGILRFDRMNEDKRNELIQENPAYGQIICRCEMISEGEIVEAINRPIGARSLDGVKRRVRAGMGRCQSGFCSPKVMTILARELDVDIKTITKTGGRSQMVIGVNKDVL